MSHREGCDAEDIGAAEDVGNGRGVGEPREQAEDKHGRIGIDAAGPTTAEDERRKVHGNH